MSLLSTAGNVQQTLQNVLLNFLRPTYVYLFTYKIVIPERYWHYEIRRRNKD